LLNLSQRVGGAIVGREECFDPQFLQCHVLWRAQRHDRAEESHVDRLSPDVDRQQQIEGERSTRLLRRRAGVTADLLQQRQAHIVVPQLAELAFGAAEEVMRDLAPVDDSAAKAERVERGAQQVDFAAEQRGIGQPSEQLRRTSAFPCSLTSALELSFSHGPRLC
jgi:hypothetical protein